MEGIVTRQTAENIYELIEAAERLLGVLMMCDVTNGVTDDTGTIDEGAVRAGEAARALESVLGKLR